MAKLFFIKPYADTLFYCYSCDWTIKIIHIFKFKIMWVKKIGYSITVFPSKKEANDFINAKKLEYINAKKYIKL